MLSLFITVGIVILFPCSCFAQVTLFQRSTKVKLDVGDSMELACSVTGPIKNSRAWTGGPGFSPLITDGVSTDTSKYTETLQTVDFSLHVHNVVVEDVCGVDYRCTNGFDTSTTETIVLNSSVFSYVPTGPEIIVQNEVYNTDKKMTILVNLTKVFPEPACTAKLGNKDVTFLSNSYDNGNCGLKSTEISITNETFDCSGNLKIECTVGSNPLTVYDVKPSSCPISQMSSSIATEGTTSSNSVSELSNTTLTMISDSTTTTIVISASTQIILNTGTTNFHSNTQTTHFYVKTETTTSYARDETSNFEANTQTNEIQTNILRIISNSMSTYQSMFVTTAVNDISGSLDSTSHMITATFALSGFSTPSYNERTITSRFETSSVFPQSFSVPPITFSVDSLSDTLLHNLHVSSGSLTTTDSSKYSMLSMTISPLMSTTLTAHISYFSKIGDLSFSYHQYVSETTVLLPKISENSPMSSAIIDTNNQISHTTNNLITSHQDDTSISFDDFTDGFQTFSPDYAALASTSVAFSPHSTDHHLSLQTTEYYETWPTEFTPVVTTSLYESHTKSAAVWKSSEELVTSGKLYLHTSMMPSQTELTSMIDFKVSTTYFEPYSRSNDEVFSSDNSLSTNLFLPFNTKANASGVYSYIKTTSMSTFESQSGILTLNPSLFINSSSIPITTVLPSFKTTWLISIMYVNSKSMQSMITPSSQQTNSGNSYIEIDSSFKDSSFSFSGSHKMNNPVTTSLSSGVFVSISTSSPNTIQSGLSEKHKTIIFITTSSAIIILIVVFLLIILAKVYLSKHVIKPRKEDDNISWSNHSSPQKAAFPDYSFTGKSIYPLLNTSSASFKMFRYDHHWNDIV